MIFRNNASRRVRRGGALLAVLWLTAALIAISFSVAATVRSETERAANLAEGIRAHFLATGAIETAILRRLESYGGKLDQPRYPLAFPGGEAIVEVVPATARLSLNEARPEQFFAVLTALGVDPARAQDIAIALVDWRQPNGTLDSYYLSLVPSFRPRHAAYQDTEEALYVRGMTPEIFYGTYTRDPQGRMVRLGAFRDCVSVHGTTQAIDVNYAEPALLASLGLAPPAVAAIVDRRRAQPFTTPAELMALSPLLGPAVGRLRVGGNTVFTFRATARPRLQDGRLSDTSRTVSALVKMRRADEAPPYQVLRWQDQTWSEVAEWR